MLDTIKKYYDDMKVLLVKGDDSLVITDEWEPAPLYIQKCALMDNMVVKVKVHEKVGKFCSNLIH